MGNLNNSNIHIVQVIEEASKCVLDCVRTCDTNMSAAMYDIWTSKLANKKRISALILKVLPPTTVAFALHVRRNHFQAAIWWLPLKPNPPLLSPVQYGWTLD